MKEIPLVDTWIPNKEDEIFTNSKNVIMAPLNKYYHIEDPEQIDFINCFWVNSKKKSYNSDDLRNHYCLYVNYFEKFFDEEKEYFTNLAKIKYLIDNYPEYKRDNLIFDINRYILQPSIFQKVINMTERNYNLELNYKSNNNPQLQYTDAHAKALMETSILMNLCIPLITHFANKRRVNNDEMDEFIIDIYDNILYAPIFSNLVINSKLYETAYSNVSRNVKNNEIIWKKQDIRGKDDITHSQDAVRNIIINIIPKYTFDKSLVSLNYTSIQKNNKFKITDIAYEYSYVPLSSSKRDGEDNSSDCDKFESNYIKTSEMLYLQEKVNFEMVSGYIYGKYTIDEDEINYFLSRLRNDTNGYIQNEFQRELIFNLFYKYYGDTQSIRALNNRDYVKLMIIARKMLLSNQMIFLPYILSGKVVRIINRKTLNKKDLIAIQNNDYYPLVVKKYKNEKIYKQILNTIGTIIVSTFEFIDKDNEEIDGQRIIIDNNILFNEFLLYALLI